MNSSSCLLVIGIFILGSLAQAAGRSATPERFYQPTAGGFAVSVGNYFYTSPVAAVSANSGLGNVNIQANMSGYLYHADFAVTESWAVHGEAMSEEQSLTLTDQFGSGKAKASGFRDYEIWLSSLSHFWGLELYIGLGGRVGLDKHLEATVQHEGNLSTGGISVANSLGLYSQLGGGDFFGLDLQYLMRMERIGNANTGAALDYRMVGGHECTARLFYELHWGDVSADLSGGYNFVDPEVIHYADGSIGTNDAYHSTVWSLGLQSQLFSVLNIRAYYESTATTERRQPIYTITSGNQNVAGVRLRLEF